jgi:hypothetical protein
MIVMDWEIILALLEAAALAILIAAGLGTGGITFRLGVTTVVVLAAVATMVVVSTAAVTTVVVAVGEP